MDQAAADRADAVSVPAVPTLSVPEVGRDSTARDVIRAAIARSTAVFFDGLPGALTSTDPEPLHRARVAVRRLRSDLRTFGPLLDHDWAGPLRDELAWTGDALGHVRDLDVLVGLLSDIVDDEPSIDSLEAAPLLEWFEHERARCRVELGELIDSDRFSGLRERLVDAAHDPRTAPQASEPARDLLPALVARPWKKLRKAVRRLGSHPADADLHRVRIRAKRCRYAADAVRPAVGKPAKRFAKAMANVQDCLGDLNDAVEIDRRLREAAATVPAHSFVAGQLSGVLGRRAAHCRDDVATVWAAASDRRLRGWW